MTDVQLCLSILTCCLFLQSLLAYLTNIVHLVTYSSSEMGQEYEVWPENSVTVLVTQLNVKSSYTVSEAALHILHTTLAITLFVQTFPPFFR